MVVVVVIAHISIACWRPVFFSSLHSPSAGPNGGSTGDDAVVKAAATLVTRAGREAWRTLFARAVGEATPPRGYEALTLLGRHQVGRTSMLLFV